MNRPHLVIATGNAHKVVEMRDLLSRWFQVVGLPTDYVSPVEDGATFAANARIKAQTAASSKILRPKKQTDTTHCETITPVIP